MGQYTWRTRLLELLVEWLDCETGTSFFFMCDEEPPAQLLSMHYCTTTYCIAVLRRRRVEARLVPHGRMILTNRD